LKGKVVLVAGAGAGMLDAVYFEIKVNAGELRAGGTRSSVTPCTNIISGITIGGRSPTFQEDNTSQSISVETNK
jgi:hypothetical protein